MKRGYQLLLYALAAVILLAVFMLYTQPDFMLTVTNQNWGCF
jgi:hypothetical protein